MTPLQRKFLERLNARGVRFVVIGGQAMRWLGYNRQTFDLDLLVETAGEMAPRLLATLHDIGLAEDISPESLARPKVRIPIPSEQRKEIDVLTSLDGLEFDDVFARGSTVRAGALEARVASAPDLLTMKLTSEARIAGDLEAGNVPDQHRPTAEAALRRDRLDIAMLRLQLQTGA